MDTVGIDRSHRRPNPLGGGLRERNGERSPPSSATDGPAELIRRDPMPFSKRKKNHQSPVAMRELRAPYVGGFVFFALWKKMFSSRSTSQGPAVALYGTGTHWLSPEIIQHLHSIKVLYRLDSGPTEP